MTRRKTGPIPVMKNHTAQISPLADFDRGEFEAIVSVYENTDLHGDIVARGAFDRTIEAWKAQGPAPLVWAHQYHQVESIIGEIRDLESTETGLKIYGKFDLDQPNAARIHALMERGIIKEFSWSGEVREYEWLDDDMGDDDFWFFPGIRMKDIDLWEAGPCFKGANPETELLSIKSGAGVARAIRAAKESMSPAQLAKLSQARDMIDEVLAAIDDDSEPESDADDAEDSGPESEESESQTEAKTIRALLELAATV